MDLFSEGLGTWALELVVLLGLLRHASAGSTAEIGYLIRIPGVRSKQPYVAVDTSLYASQ